LDAFDVVGWPRDRWELSAAESYALLYGPRTSKPSQPFKLAVLELVSRRVLELVEVERSGFFRRKKTAVLSMGDGTTDNEVLLAVQGLYVGCAKTVYPGGLVGLEVKTLTEQAGRTHSSRKGFAEAVVPDLKRLREEHERAVESGASSASVDSSEGDDSSGEDAMDFGDLDFGGFDLDVLGDLDGAFDAIDSGVDAGGGDGGDGDGGNGGD
jgi:hypothetical protein